MSPLYDTFSGTFSMWIAALTSGEYMTEHGVILPTHLFTEWYSKCRKIGKYTENPCFNYIIYKLYVDKHTSDKKIKGQKITFARCHSSTYIEVLIFFSFSVFMYPSSISLLLVSVCLTPISGLCGEDSTCVKVNMLYWEVDC